MDTTSHIYPGSVEGISSENSKWDYRYILTFIRFDQVLDYGCGEAAVLAFLAGDYVMFTKLAGVDISEEALNEAVARCQPCEGDFKQLRELPLSIDIYKGSIDEPDARLAGHEAIICTEVIEHLTPKVLERFFEVVLGIYAPRILIVTTPNAEYNVHFPALQYGKPNAIYRHHDHKFEWSRKEFETWCDGGAKKYNYTAQYKGIGLLDGKAHITENGYSTQACIFTRVDDATPSRTWVTPHAEPHQHVQHIEFPYYNEPPLSEQAILAKIEYYIQCMCDAEADSLEENRPRFSDSGDTTLAEDLDWYLPNTSDVSSTSDLPTPTPSVKEKRARWTRAPVRLPVSCLWNILDVRQICKSQNRMLDVLLKQDSNYKLQGEELIVLKAFPLPNDDSDDDVKSLMSGEEEEYEQQGIKDNLAEQPPHELPW